MIRLSYFEYNTAMYSTNLKFALGAILFLLFSLLLIYFGNSNGGMDPIAVNLLGIPVHWYGITMGLAILTGTFIVLRANKLYFKLDEDQVSQALIAAIIGGIIGARLLFVLLKWPEYAANPVEIIYLSQGGLSIHGALIGGAIGAWISTRKNFLHIANLFALGLPLSQAIGRFGNFFNQEAYGGPTALPWKIFIEPQNRPEGFEIFSRFHPTFMYEGILNLLIFFVLWKQLQQGRHNLLLPTYLILYSGVRFVIEFFRIDSDSWSSLTIAQWASLLIIVLVLALHKKWISKQS